MNSAYFNILHILIITPKNVYIITDTFAILKINKMIIVSFYQ